MSVLSRFQVGRRDPDAEGTFGLSVRRLVRRLCGSFLAGNEFDLPAAAVLRLAAIACGPLDQDRLRRHAERLALAGGIGAADARRCGEAAALHLVGRIDAAAGDDVAAAKLGHRLLCGSRNRVLQLAAVMAEGMAERWDGDGAPHGLKGEAIPIAARIAAVARRFEEAMLVQSGVSDAARGAASAMLAEAGAALDPILVLRLRSLVENDGTADAGRGGRRAASQDAASPVLAAVAAPRRVRAVLPS